MINNSTVQALTHFKLNTATEFEFLKKYYNEPHRFYHNENHINDMVSMVENNCQDFSERDRNIMVAAVLYHDVIYDVKSKTNEEDSASLFENHVSGHAIPKKDIDEVVQIILDTKHTSKPRSTLGEVICNFDLAGLKRGDLNRVRQDEWNIMLEYQQYEYADYRKGRIDFLEGFLKSNNDINGSNIRTLIDIVKNRVLNIGVYAGSFNPLHKGHLNIIEKAEKIFDKVIIARGTNPDKKNESLQDWNYLTKYRQVDLYATDLPDYLKSKANFANITLIRGLRNGHDLDYEMNQLRFLEDMDPTIEVVFIPCDKQYEHISSSAIRSMQNFSPALSLKSTAYYK